MRGLVATSSFGLAALAAELGYRFHVDGFPGAFSKMTESIEVPYSNLGTANWVIDDRDLGYRLNPSREGIHATLGIRHGDVAIPKPEDVYRILFLGDSIPWDKDGFVDRTRAALGDTGAFEVINASVPGYTSYQETLFFEKYLESTEPDLVIWTYCLNDNHRFLHRFDANARMLWTEEARSSLAIQTFWDRVVSRSYILTRWRAARLGSHANGRDRGTPKSKFPWDDRIDFSIAWKDDSWNDYEQDLERLLESLNRTGSKLAIVMFPIDHQLRPWREEDRDYVLVPQRKLRALCDDYNVPLLDLEPIFYPARRRGRLFRDGIHLRDEGHDLATESILRFLEREGLTP